MFFNRLLSSTLNKEEKWSLISTFVGLIGGSLLLLVFAKFVDEKEIALWYLYASIWGVFTVLESGFMNIISRHITYIISGKESYKEYDVNVFVRANIVIFKWLVIFITLGALFLGTYYLYYFSGIDVKIVDYCSWLLYIVSCIIGLFFSLFSSLLVGFGELALTKKYNVYSTLSNLLLVLISFYWCGFCNLLFFVLSFLVSRVLCFIISYYSLRKYYSPPKEMSSNTGEMRKIVFADMKKFFVGLVSISIQTSLFMLVISHYSSVKFIASYGFTMQVINYLINFSAIFVTSNLPLFYRLFAENNMKGLNMVFKKKWLISVGLFCTGIITFAFLFPLARDLFALKVEALAGFCLFSIVFCYILEFSVGQLTHYLGCCNDLRLIPLNFPLAVMVISLTFVFCYYHIDISYIFLVRSIIYVCIMLIPSLYLMRNINRSVNV